MGLIKKIIDKIFVGKQQSKAKQVKSKCAELKTCVNYIQNIKANLGSVYKKLNYVVKSENLSFKKQNEIITEQIVNLKNLIVIFKKTLHALDATKDFFYENILLSKHKNIDKEIADFKKVYSFVGSVKSKDSLAGKLLFAKKEKNIMKKVNVVKNQCDRMKSKINNLDSILKRTQKMKDAYS